MEIVIGIAVVWTGLYLFVLLFNWVAESVEIVARGTARHGPPVLGWLFTFLGWLFTFLGNVWMGWPGTYRRALYALRWQYRQEVWSIKRMGLSRHDRRIALEHAYWRFVERSEKLFH